MTTAVNIRFIEQADMEQLMEASQSTPFGLSCDEVLSVVRQRKTEETYDTRTFVTQIARQSLTEQGKKVTAPWVCGGYAFEKQDDCLSVVFFIIHANAPQDQVFRAIVKDVKSRVERSATRRLAVFHLRDRDEAGLRIWIPVLSQEGFTITLARNFFGRDDGWRCVYNANKEDVTLEDHRRATHP